LYGVATNTGTINTVDPLGDSSYTGPGTLFNPNASWPISDAASNAV
jgi:hypothetical protein